MRGFRGWSQGLSRVLFLLFVLAASALAGESACPEHFLEGVAPDFLRQEMALQTRELCNAGYEVMHSGLSKTPLWSAEHLTRERLAQAKGLPRVNKFRADGRIPSAERAELADYARSGFDRGHLAPSADMPTADSQLESFNLSNIVPQHPKNNRTLWGRIEAGVRREAMRRGTLYVVTGPLFAGESGPALQGRVRIPDYLFKAIYDPQRQEAGAYLVVNGEAERSESISIAGLEKRLGIDLFPQLPAGVKERLMSLPEWAAKREQ